MFLVLRTVPNKAFVLFGSVSAGHTQPPCFPTRWRSLAVHLEFVRASYMRYEDLHLEHAPKHKCILQGGDLINGA